RRSPAVTAASYRLHEDRAGIQMLLLPADVAAAGGHIRVTAAIEQRNDTLIFIELINVESVRTALTAASALPCSSLTVATPGWRNGERLRSPFAIFIGISQNDTIAAVGQMDFSSRLGQDDFPP